MHGGMSWEKPAARDERVERGSSKARMFFATDGYEEDGKRKNGVAEGGGEGVRGPGQRVDSSASLRAFCVRDVTYVLLPTPGVILDLR